MEIDKLSVSGKWEFDDKVSSCFDNMLERSIPQYEVMRHMVYSLGRRYVKECENILDLGCSNGRALLPFVNEFGKKNKYFGIEISDSMVKEFNKNFASQIKENIVTVLNKDLRNYYPDFSSCLILSILTLQFVPIEYRQIILNKVYNSLNTGGAFIIVEKVLGRTAEIDSLLVDLYYDTKSQNGYTYEQIQRKRFSLEGVLVPITASWNEDLLRNAGFSKIDCFWRCLNFTGWIAIK